MPQLGETVTEGTVTKWLKKVGDTVAQDEIIFEVSTDKVDSEVPSSASGVLSQILVQEGETVDVGTVLAIVSAEGVIPAQASAPAIEEASAPAEEAVPVPRQVVEVAPVTEPAPAVEAEDASVPEPAAAPVAAQGGASVVQSDADTGEASMLLSPVVRKLINDNRLNPAEILGTGAGGRITRSDVLAFLDKRASTVPSQPSPLPTATTHGQPEPALSQQIPPAAVHFVEQRREVPVAPTFVPEVPRVQTPAPRSVSVEKATVGARDEVIPFTNIRRRTAEHMVRSKATSPHALVSIEVDFESVERVRRTVRDQFRSEEGFSLTYLPFIARATVEAMRTYPHLNASVGEDSLIVHKDLNLSIAVDLDQDGLIAPVIHGAETKRLRGLARDIRDLADRARSKRLTADDIVGGTFTITNPGPFGTFMTVSIINQPQVAILSTDGVKRKPVVVTQTDGSESIAIHSVGIMALSFDHRVIDGAYAASFLGRLKGIIETWNWAQEL